MAHRNKASIVAARDAAQKVLSQGRSGTHLGDLLWWDFASGWTGDAGAVRTAHFRAGLDPDADWSAAPDWDVAFHRSVKLCSPALAAASCRAEHAADGAGGEERVAIVEMSRGSSVTGATIGIVALPKSGAPIVEHADARGLARAIADRAGQLVGRYTTDDARAMICTVLDRWDATPCRTIAPHIVYWAPSPASDALRRVKTMLADCGAGAILISPQHDGALEREAAGYAANAGLESKLSDLAAQIETWKAKLPSRASTVEGKIQEADRLRSTARLYREILGDAVASVDKRIDAIESGMRSVLGLVEAEKEKAA